MLAHVDTAVNYAQQNIEQREKSAKDTRPLNASGSRKRGGSFLGSLMASHGFLKVSQGAVQGHPRFLSASFLEGTFKKSKVSGAEMINLSFKNENQPKLINAPLSHSFVCRLKKESGTLIKKSKYRSFEQTMNTEK